MDAADCEANSADGPMMAAAVNGDAVLPTIRRQQVLAASGAIQSPEAVRIAQRGFPGA
jgi:hypothetical protein